ncbi:hypothetical protein QCA50_007169 [Cerrena zonata]|uniref:Uncharacterized protein n=1 Tax=Cerrena zonata TaxID=2478898 RepID=A0AAW0GAF0_9APHY
MIASDIAALALICGCSFIMLIALLPYISLGVRSVIGTTRRLCCNRNNSTSASDSEVQPTSSSTNMTETEGRRVVERYSIVSRGSSSRMPLHIHDTTPLDLLPQPSASPNPFDSPLSTAAPSIAGDASFSSSGLLSAPITPNSDLSTPSSPTRLPQNISEPEHSEHPERPATSASQISYSNEDASICTSERLPTSSYVGCQNDESASGPTDYRQIPRRLPSFMSSTTTRSQRTQLPCYEEEIPFNELRLAGGPLGQENTNPES